MSILQKFFITILLGSFLIACNDDKSGDLFNDNGGVSNVVDADFRMGSGTPFTVGQAELGLDQISSGGTTSVSVNIVDGQGLPYMEPVEVNFTSACAKALTAQLTPSVMTNNGQATSTYTADGCVNNDVITITASVGGLNLIAEATINVLSADVNSIQFVKAEPKYIGIIGTGAVGGSENSTLTFRIVDVNDDPVSNAEVSFSLNTDVGGLSLNQDSAITDDQGFVTIIVHGGTVATTVRVTAQITGTFPLIATQSSVLVVSTGIPDQDSFSLSADKYNAEGWDYDGTEVTVMARLSDAYNNPVPDGTAVSFRTEGGQIPSSCVTENGGCTVVWKSQYPRPIDGRVTVTATAIGEESFFDSNGNGRFDADEFLSFNTMYDISTDFFEDYNEDGMYIKDEDKLIDFNSNGIFDDVDGKYNGVLCALVSEGNNNVHCADGMPESKSALIRRNLVLIMSGSHPVVTLLSTDDSTTLGVDDPTDNKVVIDGNGMGSVKLEISDINNQQMPAGTKVNFSVSVGTLVAGGSNVWTSSNIDAVMPFEVVIQGSDNPPETGLLTVTIETPLGDITEIILATVMIL